MIEDIVFFCECGLRDVNQDAIFVSAEKNKGIFVVADGMGGHTGGEMASRAIVDGIRNWWDGKDSANNESGIDMMAQQCTSLLLNINAEVFSYFNERGQTGGSTVAVLILWEDRYITLSAGDSRIYRCREKKVEQLTMDDTWENLPEVRHKSNIEKIENDPRFGMLTQALGSDERLKINRGGGMLSQRDIFLLCSDGVYKLCGNKVLEKILFRRMIYKSAVRRREMLRKCVKKCGADDNYSAILCRIG